jgi:hypothetical protein
MQRSADRRVQRGGDPVSAGRVTMARSTATPGGCPHGFWRACLAWHCAQQHSNPLMSISPVPPGTPRPHSPPASPPPPPRPTLLDTRDTVVVCGRAQDGALGHRGCRRLQQGTVHGACLLRARLQACSNPLPAAWTPVLQEDPEHALRMVRFAVDMAAAASQVAGPNGAPLELRIGMHSGPVTSGVIGLIRRRCESTAQHGGSMGEAPGCGGGGLRV